MRRSRSSGGIEGQGGSIRAPDPTDSRGSGAAVETLLAATNRKFEARFGVMERLMRERGVSLAEADLDTMEAAWQQAKAHDRG